MKPKLIPIILISLAVLIAVFVGTATAKSVFLASEHHTSQFDAWNISPDGTVTKQATYTLQYSTDPAGIAIDNDSKTLFITSEFSGGVELVDPVTLTYLGVSSGPSDLAGIAVDDVNDIVYTVKRYTNNLYIFKWDAVAKTITQTDLKYLPGCNGAFGLALDENRSILWVADTAAGVVRAYDISTWTEDTTKSFTPSHMPVDVAVDRARNLVYTTSMSGGAWLPPGTGSNLLSKYDVATGIETTVDMGHPGVGVAVDEITGYVYVTGGAYAGDNLSTWDTSITPFTEIQDTGPIGNPAGLVIGNVSYNPLNLAKNDIIVGGGVSIGQSFTYEITCDNILNPTLDVEGVTITDTLPVELDFVSAAKDGVPDGIYDPVTHTVFWDIGTIPAGGTGPLIELVVRVNDNATSGSTIYNYCTIEGDQIPPTTVVDQDPNDPGDEPGTPISLCNPPTDVYADNSEAFGLFEGVVYNVNIEDVTTAYIDIQATDLVDLPFLGPKGVQFWVSIDVTYDPGNITVEPNLDDFVGGPFAAIKLIPPGSHASFKGSFCQAGTVTFELNPGFERYAVTLTLLDAIIGSGQIVKIISPSKWIDLIDALNDIPFFASASIHIGQALGEAMDKNIGKAFGELGKAGKDLVKLALDNTQRKQLYEVLIDFGFDIGVKELFKYLTKAPARVFEIFGDVIVLAIQTDLGTSGLPKVKLVAN